MARLYKKHKKYSQGRRYFASFFADFQRHGQRRRVSLGTKDERTARAKLVELERKAALGLWDPFEDAVEQTGVSVREAVRRFLRSREKHCSPATVETYTYVLVLWHR